MRAVTISANLRLLRGGSTARSMVASSGSGMVPKKPRGRVMGRGSSGGGGSPGAGLGRSGQRPCLRPRFQGSRIGGGGVAGEAAEAGGDRQRNGARAPTGEVGRL